MNSFFKDVYVPINSADVLVQTAYTDSWNNSINVIVQLITKLKLRYKTQS